MQICQKWEQTNSYNLMIHIQVILMMHKLFYFIFLYYIKNRCMMPLPMWLFSCL